ncbi:thioredoxin family protein [Leifsonia shinshuensis]|uniref:thioredoxin family protein n=1 Tax=Leifsonia TaxID=110932 RepID=UPI0028611AB4|nr:thioredoxin family protein [Leifsonia shinshuensis]MDR6970307.1 thiol-disulfide isomerase/thioredoxin [Leifsonia shinshuensis]
MDSTPAVVPEVTGAEHTRARLTLYTSAFCEPCMQTRAVLAEAARLAPRIAVTELDVARNIDRAERDGIRSTPTVIVEGQDGAEVFRAEGVPTLAQVLAAAAKAL